MTYTILTDPVTGKKNGVLRSDGAHIPVDPKNSDWCAYQAWLKAGNTPTPAVSTAK